MITTEGLRRRAASRASTPSATSWVPYPRASATRRTSRRVTASRAATSTSGARDFSAEPKRGRLKAKVEPRPTSLSTAKRPPWARTMRSQM